MITDYSSETKIVIFQYVSDASVLNGDDHQDQDWLFALKTLSFGV